MSDIAQTIETLYSALDTGDGASMAECYHPDARFRDPLFDLRGTEIGAMWRMRTGTGADLRATVADIRVTGYRALARWSATYTVGVRRRPVTHEVRAAYRFADDGRILDHVEAFDLRGWATQAFGGGGVLLTRVPGGAGLLRRRVRRQLDGFIRS